MTRTPPSRDTSLPPRRRVVSSFALATVVAGALSVVLATAAGAVTRGSGTDRSPSTGPLSTFTTGHTYRHGVLPTVAWQQAHSGSHSGAQSSGSQPLLAFGGGNNGVGVTTGHERVYLVLWGSQWGKQTSGAGGYATFSGDHSGMAPRLQAFFKGIGLTGDIWSGVMTQYCEGVAVGATSCPSDVYHAAYPTGGALAGVWEDSSSAAPSQATPSQITSEAVRGAGHFGNTNSASNRDAQYFVVSPSGTNPDDYKAGAFCAWHNFTIDASYGGIAFTNMPYLPDVGAGCGANFVNSGSAGALDAVTIVGGHEYAETITDQFPNGGWTDSSGSEVGDKCAWIRAGNPGAVQNIKLSTGTFPVQSIWANDGAHGGACEISHSIVQNGDIITVSYPGDQASAQGKGVSFQIHASDTAKSQKMSYIAYGLPPGLSLNSSTGLLSGTSSAWGTFSVWVTVKDVTGSSGHTHFNWTIGSSPVSWRAVSAPNPSSTYAQLLGVSCPSTAFCTTVGTASNGTVSALVVEQWNGHQWTAVTSSLTKLQGGLLDSVSCPSASYCAAVGSVYSTNLAPLAAQWSHGQWAVETFPTPKGSTNASLASVWCTSPTDCIAVGSYSLTVGGYNTELALADRWNGTAWSLLSPPSPSNTTYVSLNSVSCSSADNCEAIGSYANHAGDTVPLAERWNGTVWSLQQLPPVYGALGTDAVSVSCSSATACMAIGSSYGKVGGETPEFWRWNGTSWSAPTATPAPSASTGGTISGIACVADGYCTAVGGWTAIGHPSSALALSWNGSHWLTEALPNEPGSLSNQLSSISCTSASTCAATGSYVSSQGAGRTLIEQTF